MSSSIRSLLIVYASRCGQTRRIAERIAAVCQQEGTSVRVYDVAVVPASIDLAAFDVILAGGVRWSRHPRQLRAFATRKRGALSVTRSIFVSVSGAAETADGHDLAISYVQRFFRETGWQPDGYALFGGGIAFTKYGFFTRLMIRRMELKKGRPADVHCDYDYTDWDAVDRFARSLVQQPASRDKTA